MYKPLNKDQRGIAHLALIVVAVLVLGGVGFAGWRVTQKDKDTKASSTSAVASDEINKECLKELDDKDFCKFASNYQLDKVAYKMTIKSEGGEGAGTSTVLTDGKGNTQSSFDMGGQLSETIYLDKVSYMKNADDGQWYKLPSTEADSASKPEEPTEEIDFKTDFKADSENNITYKKLGKERCGKLNCFKYQIVDSTKPNETQHLYFDDKDYRMQRWYFKDADSSTDMVISYQSVKIKAPSPVKEYSTETPSQAEIDAMMQQYGGGAGTE